MPTLQFNWESCYELGIREIDDQHKQLIQIYITWAKAFLANKTTEILHDLLSKLNHYAD